MSNNGHFNIPGKLFLAGEYAVTQVGNPALIAAVQKGLQITIADQADYSQIDSDTIPEALIFDINQVIQPTNSRWGYVQATLQLVLAYCKRTGLTDTWSNFKLTIKSDMVANGQKLGLGSSAAITVGIVRALNFFFKLDLPLLTQFKLSALAHLQVQGNGSLGDVAAITYGGVIAYQRPQFTTSISAQGVDIIDQPWPGLKITPLVWPTDWQLLLGATGQAADTKKALAKNRLTASFYQDNQAIIKQLLQTVQVGNYTGLRHSLNANQSLLTSNLPSAYLTPKLHILLASLEQQACAGKVSGAGFGDNGFAILNHLEQKQALEPVWQAAGIQCQLLKIAPTRTV
ncbi:phosphomevalonate kinase [Convivina praedatoris]|uniref:phosphomevalonate kinase n=1 Tax=Convivina praedatoris TaxID=2880963 RepID=A0ABM9D1X8_9LACO|nr:phosphomevalonate kinase [Convivina sp. LMG 32447]CAH1853416.1 Phosphomevalonate kinase [Convivina sp. LMG 32447]CAH1854803.1 Phosphomevalonate kinase [Convivina sp. LMG 32447]CAH1855007.1 Phosphomevalonate kinase [Convivina sp. LMG 32447]